MRFRFCGWRHILTWWRQWAKVRHDVMSRPVRQVAAPRAKSAVSDCILFLFAVARRTGIQGLSSCGRINRKNPLRDVITLHQMTGWLPIVGRSLRRPRRQFRRSVWDEASVASKTDSQRQRDWNSGTLIAFLVQPRYVYEPLFQSTP